MQRVESVEQIEAFDLYYSLGSERSLQIVADKLGRSKRTVMGWCKKYNWDNRVIQRALEVAKQAGVEELHKETLAIRTEYRNSVNTLIEQFCKDIQEGKIKIESVEDFERLVKLDLFLMGEPTELVEVRTQRKETESKKI